VRNDGSRSDADSWCSPAAVLATVHINRPAHFEADPSVIIAYRGRVWVSIALSSGTWSLWTRLVSISKCAGRQAGRLHLPSAGSCTLWGQRHRRRCDTIGTLQPRQSKVGVRFFRRGDSLAG